MMQQNERYRAMTIGMTGERVQLVITGPLEHNVRGIMPSD